MLMLDRDGDGALDFDEFVCNFYRLADSGPFQQACLLQAGINNLRRDIKQQTATLRKEIEVATTRIESCICKLPSASAPPSCRTPTTPTYCRASDATSTAPVCDP